MTQHAVIVDAVRTPVGRRNGTLAEMRSDELAARLLCALVERSNVDPGQVDDVVAGCVTQTGEQGLNIARNAVLASGLPISIGGTSVNRLCGSGLQALVFGAASIEAGFSDVVCAVGTESMSRVAMGSDGGSLNPNILDRFGIIPQGLSAELVAQKWQLSRDQLDRYSYESHRRALAAIDAGSFTREIIPVSLSDDRVLEQDETPRRDTSMEKLAGLAPAFKDDGVITAGSSSQISDGAAAILLMSETRARELDLTPRARIRASAVVGVDPTVMLTGPIPATRKVLERAGVSLDQVDVIECNEAFASVPMAYARELEIDTERLNPRGGAIALGHPLGSTGTRLATTLIHTLEDENKKLGLVTLCIGFGQGIATLIERL